MSAHDMAHMAGGTGSHDMAAMMKQEAAAASAFLFPDGNDKGWAGASENGNQHGAHGRAGTGGGHERVAAVPIVVHRHDEMRVLVQHLAADNLLQDRQRNAKKEHAPQTGLKQLGQRTAFVLDGFLDR